MAGVMDGMSKQQKLSAIAAAYQGATGASSIKSKGPSIPEAEDTMGLLTKKNRKSKSLDQVSNDEDLKIIPGGS